MEVVASFHGGDLPDNPKKSVQHLKRYLQYAQHGPMILQTQAADPDAAPESPFEEEVIDVLRGWGYEVQPQVGVAGFRIDMAVRHPGAPGTYALGIECDGAMYHSSRAARDRDRLRKRSCATWAGGCTESGAPTGIGTDGMRWHDCGPRWRQRVRRTRMRCEWRHLSGRSAAAANRAAVAARPGRQRSWPPPEHGGRRPGRSGTCSGRPARGVRDGRRRPAPWSRPYQEVDLDLLAEVRDRSSRQRGKWGLELQDPDALDVVADVALCVVEVEGPVEKEVVYTRVRLAWGLGRAGQVVRDRIDRALRRLLKQGKIVHVGTAYDRPGHETEFARTPTERCARRVAEVPVVERQLVLRSVVDEGPGVQREDLLREAARFFGWARLGADIREALTGDIDALIAAGALIESDGGLMPVEGP